MNISVYFTYLKPAIDVGFALILLILLSPLLAIIFLCSTLLMDGVLFLDKRTGLHGKSFNVTKFKTMTDERDRCGKLLSDEARLTKYGLFLRKLSLDELPQLVNVLKGDMSLIGPRPLNASYLPLYDQKQIRRHNVKPGITGWAQVNGRNSISWQDKFKFDIYYVDNLSLFFDMKIFVLTIKKVIMQDGVSSSKSATMEPFEGNISHE